MIASARRRPLAAAATFLILELAVTFVWHATGRQVDDLDLYRRYGELVAGGALPYADFDIEYPPGSVLAFLLPALVTASEASFRVVFTLLIGLCGAAGVWVAAGALPRLGLGRRGYRLALSGLALSPLVASPVIGARFDLLPAALTTGAVLAIVDGRLRVSSALLGLGIVAKLYPAILLPVLVAAAWRRGGRRDAVRSLVPAVAITAIAYLPFLLLSPDGVAWSLSRQLARPLQIESLGAGLLLVLHQVAGLDLAWASGKGSQNLVGDAPSALATLSGLGQLAAIVGLWIAFARSPAEPGRIVRFAAALLVAFIVLGRVLSPQYLIWLVLLVPLVAGLRGRAALACLTVAGLLTTAYFPLRYWSLVKEFDALSSWLVFGRNLALLGLLAALCLPLRPYRSARSRLRARWPDQA